MSAIGVMCCEQLGGNGGGVGGKGGEAGWLGDSGGGTELWWGAEFGMDHVAGFAKEVDVDFVIDEFVSLAAEGVA